MKDPYIDIQSALIALGDLPEAAEAIAILRSALAQRSPPPKPEYVDGYLIPYWLRNGGTEHG